jgi:hypothetical protein
MNLPFSGGCSCGAVRYECNAEPTIMFKCHCRDCQRATGTGASCVVYVPLSAFRFTKGSPNHHCTPSLDGTQNKRGFCSACGSPLTGGKSETGIGIHAASLDDPSWFRPQIDMHVTDVQPWDILDPALPKFELYPDV